MKTLTTIFLMLVILTSLGQDKQPKEFGIGFAIATNSFSYGRSSFPNNIFSDKELTTKWTSDKVMPFFFKPDYGLYHFICLEKTDEYYKILVNDNQVAFLPNDTNYYFKTWDAILLQSTVDRLTKDNPIRQEWNDESEIIENNCEFDRLTVQDVILKDGEYWLQIYFSPDCEVYFDKNSRIEYGWIKWRKDGKLLVRVLLLC